MKRPRAAVGMVWGAVARAAHLAFQAVFDVLVEDACVICARPPAAPTAGPSDPLDERLTRAVVVRHYRAIAIINHPVCAACASEFVRTRGDGVLGTARGAVVTIASGDRFGGERVGADAALDIPILAPFMTEDRVLKLVHQVKFSGYRALGGLLGAAVAAHVAASAPGGFDYVVPVPMSVFDLRRRGYNLPTMLARAIAAETAMCCNDNMLEKLRKTRRQSQTPSELRAGNVRGAYQAADSARGKRVLVVDDLVTSGATAADCCAALLAAGAATVAVACIGRAL